MTRSAETLIGAIACTLKESRPGNRREFWAGVAGRDEGGEGVRGILTGIPLDVQDEYSKQFIITPYGSTAAPISRRARRGAALHARGRARARRSTRAVAADPPARGGGRRAARRAHHPAGPN